jgi:hypothetical protein
MGKKLAPAKSLTIEKCQKVHAHTVLDVEAIKIYFVQLKFPCLHNFSNEKLFARFCHTENCFIFFDVKNLLLSIS